jgi:hypothetical protein
MTKKLTLSVNEKTIEKAKRISRKRGKSISKMIEEYLDSINEKETQEETAVDKIKKIMNKYRDKIKISENTNYKDQIKEWRYEDYIKNRKNKNG